MRHLALALAFLATATASTLPAHAAAINVVINGQTMTFDQPPVEQGGRVFVPLRGVFETLGASVVYANGVINATGNGKTISLKVGSNQAIVNGQPQYLDVAPFMIGSRTLVPLRFVAQALGASVNWEPNANSVIITGGGGGGGGYPPQPPASFALLDTRPTGTVRTGSPQIHARFSQPIRQDTLRVAIDGNDVTASVYSNATGFDVTPPTPLYGGSHSVTVNAVTQAGQPVSASWSFNTQTGGGYENFIQNVSPPNGAQGVGTNFTVSGRTLPGSRVHIVATANANSIIGIIVGNNTYATDVVADGSGNYGATISLNGPSGTAVRVLTTSVAPGGSSKEVSATYRI